MKILACLVLLVGGAAIADGGDFCTGYQAGFVRGYCRNHGGQFGCLQPLPPMCPLPKLDETNFADGYDRGFLDGFIFRR